MQVEVFCFGAGKKVATEPVSELKSIPLLALAGSDGKNLKSPFVRRSPGFLSLEIPAEMLGRKGRARKRWDFTALCEGSRTAQALYPLLPLGLCYCDGLHPET